MDRVTPIGALSLKPLRAIALICLLTGGAPVGSLAAVQKVFSKLGMSPDMVSKFAPFLTNAVGSVGGPELAGSLGALFQ